MQSYRILTFFIILLCLSFSFSNEYERNLENPLYISGAGSFSSGGNSAFFNYELFSLQLNPAFFKLFKKRSLSISLGSFNKHIENDYWGLGYLIPNKYGIIFNNIEFEKNNRKKQLVLSATYPKEQNILWGANIGITSFKNNIVKGKAVSLSIGALYNYNLKTYFSFSINDMISWVKLNIDDLQFVGQNPTSLPTLFNVGFSRVINDKITIFSDFKYGRRKSPFKVNSYKMYSGGFSFDLLTNLSLSLSFEADDFRTFYRDKKILVGLYYLMDDYYFHLSSNFKNDVFKNVKFISVGKEIKKHKEESEQLNFPQEEERLKKEKEFEKSHFDDEESEVEEDYKPKIIKRESESKEDLIIDTIEKSSQPKSVEKLEIREFAVYPLAIFIPREKNFDISFIKDHWSYSSFNSLNRKGILNFFDKPLKPTSHVKSEDFFNLLFIAQLYKNFELPISVKFYLSSSCFLKISLFSGDKNEFVLEENYYKQGFHEFILSSFLLKRKNIRQGRYSVVVAASNEDELVKKSESIIVFDSTIIISKMGGVENISNLKAIVSSFNSMGINIDFIFNLFNDKFKLTRLNALKLMIDVLGDINSLKIRKDDIKKINYKDLESLSDKDISYIYLASLPLNSLKGSSFMVGNKNNIFDPHGEATLGEVFSIIERFIALKWDDFKEVNIVKTHTKEKEEAQVVSLREDEIQKKFTTYYLVARMSFDESEILNESEKLKKEGFKTLILKSDIAGRKIFILSVGQYFSETAVKNAIKELNSKGIQVKILGDGKFISFRERRSFMDGMLPTVDEVKKKRLPSVSEFLMDGVQ